MSYDTNNIFLDIDLDYFISQTGNHMNGKGFVTMTGDEITKIINPNRDYIKKIYNYLEGITIATEQKYCGGNINSFKILSTIENIFFNDGKEWK